MLMGQVLMEGPWNSVIYGKDGKGESTMDLPGQQILGFGKASVVQGLVL